MVAKIKCARNSYVKTFAHKDFQTILLTLCVRTVYTFGLVCVCQNVLYVHSTMSNCHTSPNFFCGIYCLISSHQ